MENESETGCCPRFNPEPWDEKEFDWKDKLFVKDSIRTFMHIPLNIKQVMTRMWKNATDAGATPDMKDFLVMAHDPTPWRSDQYMAVTKEIPGMENTTISGVFLTKVFEGPYKDARKWHKEMQEYAKAKGKKPQKIYFFYTTCPKCAKYYGKNYVVSLAEV